MNRGDVVVHSLGPGRILRLVPRGEVPGAWVDWGWLKDWVPLEELALREKLAEWTADRDPGHRDCGMLEDDEADARRAIVALKLGQVPANRVLGLSMSTDDARDTMERIIHSVAKDRRPQSILFQGGWGTGKTHLLTMLTALAAESRLATASVILDGEGVTLFEPKGLMAGFLGSLAFPDEAMPIPVATRLADIRGQPRRLFSCDNRVIDAVFRVDANTFHDPEAANVIVDYITLQLPAYLANRELRELGHRWCTLPPLTAWRVIDRADRFCELLSGWVEIVTQTCDGLVLLVDELDVEYYRTSRDTQQDRKLRRRRAMLLEALGRLFKEYEIPLLIAFGVAPDIVKGNDPVDELRESFENMMEIDVPVPDTDQKVLLGRQLRKLYATAYPDRVAAVDLDESVRRIEDFAREQNIDDNPRRFVRGTLELLDLMSCQSC